MGGKVERKRYVYSPAPFLGKFDYIRIGHQPTAGDTARLQYLLPTLPPQVTVAASAKMFPAIATELCSRGSQSRTLSCQHSIAGSRHSTIYSKD